MKPDFSGYATKFGIECSDGRTIMPEAFAHMDKVTVPLVWQHQHDSADKVLGHAILEKRDDGMYTYGFFNDTDAGQNAKKLVIHGDIVALSIYANGLKERNKHVEHGDIREVSIVLAGANPGAFIDNLQMEHADGSYTKIDGAAIIFSGESLEHEDMPTDSAPTSEDGETIQDIFDTLTDKQREVFEYMLGTALQAAPDSGDPANTASTTNTSTDSTDSTTSTDAAAHANAESGDPADAGTITHNQEGTTMKHNVFEATGETLAAKATLTHAQIQTIVTDAQSMGSFKDALLSHAVEYGIENIELLFPDAKAIDSSPEFISRRQEWVQAVISGTRKVPFSKIKSLSADITLDTARAKGYVKATMKKEEFFALSKRETSAYTIYKKQKLDRDDIIDITEMDVVAWLKGEMRLMLDEEIARAILVGDGREIDDEFKINETKIRPIAHDDNFYAHQLVLASNVYGDGLVESILRARPNYRGSGNPAMYCTEDVLTDLLLVKDRMGRRLYETEAALATALRVSKIVTVPVMEDHTTDQGDLLAILVNLSDYTVGSNRGGQVSMFEDFDIDFNQNKYLIEGRFSGALTKYKTAIIITRATGTSVTPTIPTFVTSTGVLTIPTVTGVAYHNAETGVLLASGAQTAIAAEATVYVEAVPTTGYFFPHNFDADWEFTRDAA